MCIYMKCYIYIGKSILPFKEAIGALDAVPLGWPEQQQLFQGEFSQREKKRPKSSVNIILSQGEFGCPPESSQENGSKNPKIMFETI